MSHGQKTVEYNHKFNDVERERIADNLTEEVLKKNEVEDAKSESAKEFNAQLKDIEAEINRLAKLHHNGYEKRNEVCDLRLNRETEEREWYSVKTGELVKTEPFEKTDYQYTLEEGSDEEGDDEPTHEFADTSDNPFAEKEEEDEDELPFAEDDSEASDSPESDEDDEEWYDEDEDDFDDEDDEEDYQDDDSEEGDVYDDVYATKAAIRILKDAGADPRNVNGTGHNGKITKPDAEDYVESMNEPDDQDLPDAEEFNETMRGAEADAEEAMAKDAEDDVPDTGVDGDDVFGDDEDVFGADEDEEEEEDEAVEEPPFTVRDQHRMVMNRVSQHDFASGTLSLSDTERRTRAAAEHLIDMGYLKGEGHQNITGLERIGIDLLEYMRKTKE